MQSTRFEEFVDALRHCLFAEVQLQTNVSTEASGARPKTHELRLRLIVNNKRNVSRLLEYIVENISIGNVFVQNLQ